jgi:hypothetical protein
MQLFTLLYGKSKKRMHPIMIDERRKCENYRDARENSGVKGWHDIQLAESGAKPWRQKSATVGGNKCESVQRVGKGPAGYISKHGFEAHT